MVRHGYLGQFEQVVLLTLVRLGDGAHGRSIHEEIERRSPDPVTIAAVYVTLSRLEDKGYVSAEVGDSRPAGGGRARKEFRIEAPGLEALRHSRERMERFWEGLELEARGES